MPWFPLFPTFKKEQSEKVVRALIALNYKASYNTSTLIDADLIEVEFYKIEEFLNDLTYFASKGKYKNIKEVANFNKAIGRGCEYSYFVCINVPSTYPPTIRELPKYKEYLETHKEYSIIPIVNILMNDVIEMAQGGSVTLSQDVTTGCLYFSFPGYNILIKKFKSPEEIEMFLGLREVEEVFIKEPTLAKEEARKRRRAATTAEITKLKEEIEKLRKGIEALGRIAFVSAGELRDLSFRIEELATKISEIEKMPKREDIEKLIKEIEELKKELERIRRI